MGINNIDNNELNFSAKFSVQFFCGRDPLPKWWSGKRPKDHYNWFFDKKLGKLKLRTINVR